MAAVDVPLPLGVSLLPVVPPVVGAASLCIGQSSEQKSHWEGSVACKPHQGSGSGALMQPLYVLPSKVKGKTQDWKFVVGQVLALLFPDKAEKYRIIESTTSTDKQASSYRNESSTHSTPQKVDLLHNRLMIIT